MSMSACKTEFRPVDDLPSPTATTYMIHDMKNIHHHPPQLQVIRVIIVIDILVIVRIVVNDGKKQPPEPPPGTTRGSRMRFL